MPDIRLAETDDDIRGGFTVMAELRPHLTEHEFVPRVRRQMETGYRLALLRCDDGRVAAVAGYRPAENLAWGRFLYVDDLVTSDGERSRGHGRSLIDWLIAEARRNGCVELHLDSGVQRFAAHRFYLRSRFDITCHHFALRLT